MGSQTQNHTDGTQCKIQEPKFQNKLILQNFTATKVVSCNKEVKNCSEIQNYENGYHRLAVQLFINLKLYKENAYIKYGKRETTNPEND